MTTLADRVRRRFCGPCREAAAYDREDGIDRPARRCRTACPWPSAATLDDLAAGTAAWLEGAVPTTPTHLGPPEPETAPIRDRLIRLNRGGLFTDSSQPGLVTAARRQRAYVSGFASRPRVDLLYRIAGGDVVVFHRPPHRGPDAAHRVPDVEPVPVTVDAAGDAPHTWAGGWEHPDETEAVWRRTCGPAAVDAVMSAWQFCVVDLAWGRETTVFDRIAGGAG